jgi:hypothetical protein
MNGQSRDMNEQEAAQTNTHAKPQAKPGPLCLPVDCGAESGGQRGDLSLEPGRMMARMPSSLENEPEGTGVGD